MSAAALSANLSSDAMAQRNFARIAAYVQSYSGIKMPATKKTMLEGRLRRRLRASEFRTLDAYCDHIFSDDNLEREGPHLINAVTTNKTDFFREPAHFDYLRDVALPEFDARRLRKLRVWSAACSTGPEVYTIAMVLADYAAHHGGPNFEVLATDLDTEVLATARAGIYPAEAIDPVPPALARTYLMAPRDKSREVVRVVPRLRSAVGFARLNLMDSHYPVGDPFHLIFCRNVLIYFDKPTQRAVVSRLVDCLEPGGLLFLGHSESITGQKLPLEQVANTVFRRV